MESDSISLDLQAIDGSPSHLAQRQAISITTQKGNLARWDFIAAAEAFLELSIDKAFASDNPLLGGLGVIDRRVGRRRLKEMLAGLSLENPLVRRLLEVRCATEGIRFSATHAIAVDNGRARVYFRTHSSHGLSTASPPSSARHGGRSTASPIGHAGRNTPAH